MSGGHFEYIDSHLKDESFGWTDSPSNVFEDREISELVWDMLNLIHDFDWYASGDTCKETYLKAKADFKKKWMSNRGVRVRRIVDEAIQRTKDELYETFGLEEGADNIANGVTMQKWIPVTERLPEQGQQVIVYSGNILLPSVFAYHFWNKDYDSWAHITHWMHLPQPPKGE